MLKLIIIYSYFVIFSGWIFNLLHLPPELAEIIIQALDVLPFLLVLFIFRLRSSMSILPNTTTFWIIIVLFIINSICTTVIHNGRILAAITHFLIMFRYMPLAVLLANRRISDHDEMLYIKHFKIISIILIIIGFIEIVGGPGVASYFTPVLDEFSSVNRLVDSNTESTIMPIFGVFPNTVDYSFFLLISYIIISNRPGSANFIWGIIYGILIYFTGSKATLLIFLLVISIQLSKHKSLVFAFWGTVIIGCGVLIYQYWELFYWTVFIDSQASRLGYIIFTLPDFLSELSFDTFFGVCPDKELVWMKINSYADAPSMTWTIEHMTSFEDEFYVALPVYYGLYGFCLLLIIFAGMYKSLIKFRWHDRVLKYRMIIKSLFICLLIAPLFNQIIILRPFSLSFWIIIGIMISQMQASSGYSK